MDNNILSSITFLFVINLPYEIHEIYTWKSQTEFVGSLSLEFVELDFGCDDCLLLTVFCLPQPECSNLFC